MSKKSKRQLVDIFLLLLLILLMSSQSTEQKPHEFIGIFALFTVLAHQILNLWWYKNALKIQKNPLNLTLNFINLALIISFILSIFSGLSMSKYATPFLNGIIKISTAREFHLCLTHWFFVFAGLHIGFHALKLATYANKSKIANSAFVASWLISIYGFWLFLDTGMVDYMLAKVQFAFLDFKIPLYQSMLLNAIMLFSWAFIGFLIANFIKNLRS